MMTDINNVLAERYASEAMKEIWSAKGKILLERDLWIAVMKAQRELGLDIPEEAIRAYESKRDEVDIESIKRREAITRHDVKARIEEFCDLAGYEHIHKGMTSRDLTENVEQLQILRSMHILQTKAAATVQAFAERAKQYRDLVLPFRTHNVAAQPGTFGKRLSVFGAEMLRACKRLQEFRDKYPVRGLKGAIGTQLDQLTLFEGNREAVADLEDRLIKHLGFKTSLANVGQIYPRSLDFELISTIYQLGSAPSSFAKTLRLMAGHELASEGFARGQVGSSAMPHKMNSRSCERINGFLTVLRGYMTMAEGLAGDQWNEGDVACSVVRRVMLPDSLFAIDGMLETTMTVLAQMEAYPAVIERENRHYLPFLATTTILMKAVNNGSGRENAHEAIKEHALAVVKELRSGQIEENDLVNRLSQDDRIKLDKQEIQSIIDNATDLTGLAKEQVDSFLEEADSLLEKYPDAKEYSPAAIL